MRISVIGLNLAKHVFQVHGIDSDGKIVVRKKMRRGEVLEFFAGLDPCLVGMEACATGHYWAREIAALGHQVRLISPSYVKPYVKRQKNDAADAEAICEAVTRPSMRFVPVKTVEQQSLLMLHRARNLLIGQKTMTVNAIRAHLAEFGLVAPQGRNGFSDLVDAVLNEEIPLTTLARTALVGIIEHYAALMNQIRSIEKQLLAWHRGSEASQRLETIPGVGPIVATALVATIPNAQAFSSGRQLAAWIGLVPRQSSSGGKQRLGRITKQGEPYLRRLLVVGAAAVVRRCGTNGSGLGPWITGLRERRPGMVAVVALANKIARIAWAILTKNEVYRPRVIPS